MAEKGEVTLMNAKERKEALQHIFTVSGYLGSIGGPAALLAQENIKEIECVEYPELGMEAVWKIRVENFPAFIIVDDKGNDFFADFAH